MERETLRRWLHEPPVPDAQPSSAPAAGWPVVSSDIHDFIRLTAQQTAQEMVQLMSRRRERVPARDPVLEEMVADINAALARMTLEGVAAAKDCVNEVVTRLEAEGKRLPANRRS